MLSDDEKPTLLSKAIRAILLSQNPLNRSYRNALETHYGQTSSPAQIGQELKRKTAQLQRAIRSMSLLSMSLPPDEFSAAFATDEFIQLVRSVLGIGALDETVGKLKKDIAELNKMVQELALLYREDMASIKKEYEILDTLRGEEFTKEAEAKSAKERRLSREYTRKHEEAEAAIKLAQETIKGYVMPFDPIRARIASDIGKSSLECILKQFSHVEKNPDTFELYETPLNKAARLTETIVREINDNVQQVKLLKELEEYKAKKAAKGRKKR